MLLNQKLNVAGPAAANVAVVVGIAVAGTAHAAVVVVATFMYGMTFVSIDIIESGCF